MHQLCSHLELKLIGSESPINKTNPVEILWLSDDGVGGARVGVRVCLAVHLLAPFPREQIGSQRGASSAVWQEQKNTNGKLT